MKLPTAVLILLTALPLSLFTACNYCNEPPALAELEQKQGDVTRDFQNRQKEWQDAPVGAEFRLGDAVRTAAASTTRLKLADGARLQLEEKTTVRFSGTRPDSEGQPIDVQTGNAMIEAGERDLRLQTSVGVAVLQAGSRIRLNPTERGLRFDVDVGAARLLRDGQEAIEIAAGEGLEVGIGTAVLERFTEAPDAAAPAPAPELDAGGPKAAALQAEIEGNGALIRRPDEKAWVKLAPGSNEIEFNSALRLRRGTSAQVRRRDQTARLGPGSYVLGGETGQLVHISGGEAQIEASRSDVTLKVPGGVIVVKADAAGSRASVAVTHKGAGVEAQRGLVIVQSPEQTEQLLSGERADLNKDGKIAVMGRTPPRADFKVGAGGSFAVHDPNPPSIVGVTVGSTCPGVAVVKRTGTGGEARFRGQGVINAVFPQGSHHYGVHCVGKQGLQDKPAKTGGVVVIRDAGTANLPTTSPYSRVDTDGRRYTVLYQNRLPHITVSWPHAPKAESYRLSLIGAPGKSQSITSPRAKLTFPPGAVAEGTYKVSFQAAGQTSPVTLLSIRFDNAAPTATIRAPANRSFPPGARVSISGVALPGWKVYAGGAAVPMDAQQRFSGSAVAPTADRALALQLSHRFRGVHYYLRRSSGAE